MTEVVCSRLNTHTHLISQYKLYEGYTKVYRYEYKYNYKNIHIRTFALHTPYIHTDTPYVAAASLLWPTVLEDNPTIPTNPYIFLHFPTFPLVQCSAIQCSAVEYISLQVSVPLLRPIPPKIIPPIPPIPAMPHPTPSYRTIPKHPPTHRRRPPTHLPCPLHPLQPPYPSTTLRHNGRNSFFHPT